MSHLQRVLSRSRLTRRNVLCAAGMGCCGISASGWFHSLESALAQTDAAARVDGHAAKRSCILLWMSGGPSQLDTFDLKPGHTNGGEFREIATSVPGIRISEHLPQLAQQADKLAIVRSLTTSEGDHARGTYLVRTGQRPGAAVAYPTIGSGLAKQMGNGRAILPDYFNINPFVALNPDAYAAGFLGPRYAATNIMGTAPAQADGYATLRLEDLEGEPLPEDRISRRRSFWSHLQDSFFEQHGEQSPQAHETLYERAFRLLDSGAAAEAFDLAKEPATIRDRYGRGLFGQGCLLARRLVERGVPLVEVSLGGNAGGLGWDTHQDNFPAVKELSAELDAGWATLMSELSDRGLLDTTTILWIGEFGRTPTINTAGGRDHFPDAWSCVLAGGGIQGGQVHGQTSEDGLEVEQAPVEIGNILHTLCDALQISPDTENYNADGRPIPLVEHGETIRSLLT